MTGRCHICGGEVVEIEAFTALARVTSDCEPWAAGGRLLECRRCGVAQKVLDDAWRADTAAIYADYRSYHQSGGVEQAVFASGAAGRPRSEVVLERAAAVVALPTTGRLLDVGCGVGVTLRAASTVLPGWSLTGSEMSDRNRAVVEGLPGVERFHVGSPLEIDATFDLVTMVHVLEHIEAPAEFLAHLAAALEPGGALVVQVPDATVNPFDLLVADHSTHVSLGALEWVLRRAGYDVIAASADWLPKELSVVGRPGGTTAAEPAFPDEIGWAGRHVAWLGAVKSAAEGLAAKESVGIFGTSIAGTWLWSQLGEGVGFFVDEDRSRTGRPYRGVPVVSPDDVEKGADVFLGLPWGIAERVGKRLARGPGRYHAVDPDGHLVGPLAPG